MLHHRFPGAEGTGYGGGAALGHGEHGVDDPLAGLKRRRGREFPPIGPPHTDGPLLHHGQLLQGAVRQTHLGDDVPDGVCSCLCHPLHGAVHAVGDHDLVEHRGRLRHGTQHVPGHHGVAGLGHRGEIPLLILRQRRGLNTTGDVGPGHAADLLQRALDAVVNALDQPRPQLHGQGSAGGDHLRTRPQTGGLLIDLNGRPVAGHIQYLSDQLLGAHTHHVRHVGVRHAVGYHQRPGDFDYFAHSYAPFK